MLSKGDFLKNPNIVYMISENSLLLKSEILHVF